MQRAGCLAFADDLTDWKDEVGWHPVKVWLIRDPTDKNRSARRLDGKGWQCCGGAKSRCISGPGSKGWPIGLTLAKPGQRLDVVEGDGDYLALWHLHAISKDDTGAPVAMLGACAGLQPHAAEIAPYIRGRIVRIFPHIDRNGAGQKAAQSWCSLFYDLGAAEVHRYDLTTLLREGGKDLNDAISNHALILRERAPHGKCPICFAQSIIARIGGPTCGCLPYEFPPFTHSQIS